MQKIIIIEPLFDDEDYEKKIEEITALIDSAGAEAVCTVCQKIKTVTPSTFIGKGKVQEVKAAANLLGADICIFDGDLSPSQTLNLSDEIGLPVITRTNLILDIFAQRALSSEGKLLVELAQLKYIYPRLKGKGDSLSRLGAGIGTRGPGETKLETDRRHIRGRILSLEKSLEKISSRRNLEYLRRKKNRVKTVVLVGYTNVGKSTLLNLLSKSDDLAMDKLFATLDTSSKRAFVLGYDVVFIDTVGFIKNIPDDLIDAFKSTLECVKEADLILNVADCTKNWEEQFSITEEILNSLGANCEIVKILNKCDMGISKFVPSNILQISAKSNHGIIDLKNLIIQKLGLKR